MVSGGGERHERRAAQVANGPFAWWEPHQRTRREAMALFFGAAAVLASYLGAFLAIAGVCAALGGAQLPGAAHTWADSAGPAGVVAVVLLGYVLLVVVLTQRAWHGLPARQRRLLRARPPQPGEADGALRALDTFAPARGIPVPALWIVDDPAPNACVIGHAPGGAVCLTTGALRLARGEVSMLCAYEVTLMTSRSYAYATAATSLLMSAERLTAFLWAAAAIVLVSTLVGVPPAAAGAIVLGIALLVVLTRPVVALGDRVLPRLFDEVGELCDLETARLSAEPQQLAKLLLQMLQDGRRVHCRWQVAHLWFERESVNASAVASAWTRWSVLWPLTPDEPRLTVRMRSWSRRGLVERAATAVEQCDDPDLRARFARATSSDA